LSRNHNSNGTPAQQGSAAEQAQRSLLFQTAWLTHAFVCSVVCLSVIGFRVAHARSSASSRARSGGRSGGAGAAADSKGSAASASLGSASAGGSAAGSSAAGSSALDDVSWYPREKIRTARRKLRGDNPAAVLVAELTGTSHRMHPTRFDRCSQYVLGKKGTAVRAKVRRHCHLPSRGAPPVV
jgi:hypothetical protein